VRLFEQPDTLLANTWIVVRIDGRGFSKYVCNSISNSFPGPSSQFTAQHAGTRPQREPSHELGRAPQAHSSAANA
jgi:hypothetical protein